MYVSGYEADPQLAGLGSKLKKLVKKVVKPIAHIGAAVMTGGASLAVSSALIQKSAQKKAIAAQQKMVDDANAAALAETLDNFDGNAYRGLPHKDKRIARMNDAQAFAHWNKYGRKAGIAFPRKGYGGTTSVAPVAPVVPVTTVAPTAAAVTQAAAAPTVQPLPMPTHVPTFMQPTQYAPTAPVPVQYEPFEPSAEVSQAKLPGWVIPAGIGAAGLLLFMSQRGGRGRR